MPAIYSDKRSRCPRRSWCFPATTGRWRRVRRRMNRETPLSRRTCRSGSRSRSSSRRQWGQRRRCTTRPRTSPSPAPGWSSPAGCRSRRRYGCCTARGRPWWRRWRPGRRRRATARSCRRPTWR